MEDGVYDNLPDLYDVCSKTPPKEFCKGDLGGPLVCNVKGKAVVVGVIADSVSGNSKIVWLHIRNLLDLLTINCYQH